MTERVNKGSENGNIFQEEEGLFGSGGGEGRTSFHLRFRRFSEEREVF